MRLARAALVLVAVAAAATGAREGPRAASGAAPAILQLVAPGHPAYLLAAENMKESFLAGAPEARVTTINLDLPDAVSRAMSAIAAEPTMIFAVGSRAVKAVRESGTRAPLVYAMVLDPPSLGLPAPGEARDALVTGVSMDVTADPQLDLIRELVPAARRIGVLYDPLISGEAVRRAQSAAQTKGLTLVTQAVRGEGEVVGAASLIVPSVDVLWAVADPTVLTAANSRALILIALRARKPLLAVSEGFVRSGAVAAIAADPAEVGHRAGELALRMVEASPAKPIRPEGPPHLALFLNRATADHIGIRLSATVIGRARAVYPLP